jgi:hypothetical protein
MKKKTQELVLSRETLRHLSYSALSTAKGGNKDTTVYCGNESTRCTNECVDTSLCTW